ncbi:MAG: S41 family peptidase [Lautropia sp.]|nr:S41 family peptidase [Lautropia sp.]
MNKATILSVLVLLSAGVLSGCGGGPAGRPLSPVEASPDTETIDGPIGRASDFAQQCAADNTLARNSAGSLLPGYREGSREIEQRFVRAYMNEAYLWYREVPLVDARLGSFRNVPYEDGITHYFQSLRSQTLTANNKLKDRFSFVTTTADWKALSEAGVQNGYGADLAVLSGTVPRDIRVSLVHGDTPAAPQLRRGDRLLRVRTADGRLIDVVNTRDADEIELISALLFNPDAGTQLVMEFDRSGSGVVSADLVAGEYTAQSVHTSAAIATGAGDDVGYLMVRNFNLPLEGQLQRAMTELKARDVKDVVVDLRYNGGGYLYQSAQLAYMLADPALSKDKVFERMQYNDKRLRDNGSSNSLLKFMSTTTGRAGSGTERGKALPNLGLKRVYVLTGPDTCSASESLINGLQGIDVEVIQIGSTTCGKPYGFTAKDNCGMSYFPIEFVGVNEKGFGDFDEGFAPDCVVADDFGHQLGDVREGLLAAALHHREHGSCPAGTSRKLLSKSLGSPPPGLSTPLLTRDPLHTSKFLLP